jgi:hypothetical protein
MKIVWRCGTVAWIVAAALTAVAAAGVDDDGTEKSGEDSRIGVSALRTVAEESNFEATALHAQVVTLLDALAAAAPDRARRFSMGRSVEGREIPLLVLSEPAVESAEAARALAQREGRVVCFLFGNIHAGEVDGKEALPMLARELLLRDEKELLKKTILVLAPIYNCDGNERVGAIEVNRPGQAGPIRGAGQRHNAMDLDLNRDFVKLESPEARAFAKMMNEWDPHVVIDCHTTDGSYHRYLITYAGPKVPAGDPALIAWVRDGMFPRIDAVMRDRHTVGTFFYGDFEGDHETPPRPHTRWTAFPALPRYSTGYVGLRGRIGILSEAYSYAPYEDRVRGTLHFCRAIVEDAAERRGEVRRLTREADAWSSRATEVVLRSREAPAPGRVTIQGWEEEVRDGRSRATTTPRDYVCELLNRYEATLSIPRPWGYVLTKNVPKVVENLRLHGVIVEVLAGGEVLDCEVYTIDSAKAATRIWQGHALMEVEATPTRKSIRAEKGWSLIRTDQPLGVFASYLLEPECEDGLTTWNYFDEFLDVGAEFPVARVVREPAR